MKNSLIIPLFGLVLAFPCMAVQQFVWLTDSRTHQGLKYYRQILELNTLTLPQLMQGVDFYQAEPVQATTERAMVMLKSETAV